MRRGITWRGALRHRFVWFPLAVAAAVAAWNVHVALNADGVIEGTVRDAAGAPVAGAEVIFFERNFVNYQEKRRATTDGAGGFRFEDMRVHVGQLEAVAADGRRSQRLQLRLWFRAQHTRAEPLVLASGS
jgi:hypothetical protein